MSSLIVANLVGNSAFCVDQAFKSLNEQIDGNEVQVRMHDHQTLFQAITDPGPKKIWVHFDGGNGYTMGENFPVTIRDKIVELWKNKPNFHLSGTCAGGIFLGQPKSLYCQTQSTKTFSRLDSTDNLTFVGAYCGSIAAPCFPFTFPYEDPSNCQTIEVNHQLLTGEKIKFHSLWWLGPAFPLEDAYSSTTMRTITEDIPLDTNEAWPFDTLHGRKATDLPLAVLQKNEIGNKILCQGDHLEISPKSLTQAKFEELYEAARIKVRGSEIKHYELAKDTKAQNFRKVQKELIYSNSSRLIALRDGMSRIEIPLIKI